MGRKNGLVITSPAWHCRLPQEEEAVRAYWTPERMAKAKSRDRLVLPEAPAEPARRQRCARHVAGPPKGRPMLVPPVVPRLQRGRFRLLGPVVIRRKMQRFGYDYPFPFERYQVFTSYKRYPYSTFGKVFFTNVQTGEDFVCSGTVVNAGNQSLIWTAGHCVHGGQGGAFHINWMFAPAYKDGKAPFGIWVARVLATLRPWTEDGNKRFDLGAAVVTRNLQGLTLVEAVGAQGIAFNLSRIQHWHATGYPAASPFNGERQFINPASLAVNDCPPGPRNGPKTLGIGNDLTGGSSGGGWVLRFPAGFVNSVNSYGYEERPLATFGPYHGKAAQTLYLAVRDL